MQVVGSKIVGGALKSSGAAAGITSLVMAPCRNGNEMSTRAQECVTSTADVNKEVGRQFRSLKTVSYIKPVITRVGADVAEKESRWE